MSQQPISYKQAGVDIDAQDQALAKARSHIRATFTPGVVSDVGLFGGVFDVERMGAGGELLVASADGVGTKLEVAKRAGIHHTVGRDLVQHCINDILCQGARPLFFLDYVGTGVLEPQVVADLIRGCAEACADHGVALLGGETAEMPGLYARGDFDLVGFIVGSVRRDRMLDGSRVRPGQKLIGLLSDGLHTNGYSLARMVAFERLGLGLDQRPGGLGGRTLQEALLAPHRCYLKPLWPLLEAGAIAGIAHITGGGLPGNVNRILRTADAQIQLGAWQVPPLFRMLVEEGGVPAAEAYRAFNMGVGIVLAVEAADEGRILADLAASGETAFPLGELVPGTGKVRLLGTPVGTGPAQRDL